MPSTSRRRCSNHMRMILLVSMALASLAGAPQAADHVVVVDKLKFGPLPVEVHVGDTIVWRNDDILRHSATARDEGFDVDLPAKSEARLVVEAAGTYEFFCKFHPGMTGTLVVLP
jgi:plastocyanin